MHLSSPRAFIFVLIVIGCSAGSAWANSATYPALGFGPTPAGGTFTFTPGIGNSASVSNVPVMQIGASSAGFPLTNFMNVTGTCGTGGGGCLNVQTGPETGAGPGGFNFGAGGSITLTGTIGSFTGVIFQGSFSPCLAQTSACVLQPGFLDQFGKVTVNPAVLSMLGISNASEFSHFINYFFLSNLTFQNGTYHGSVASGAGGGLATPEPESITFLATGIVAILGAARKTILRS